LKKKPKGKYSYNDYPDAQTINIPVGNGLETGCKCPECNIGKLYISDPRRLLSFSGTAPVNVKRYSKEVLRCNACQKEFMNSQRIDKWTNSARSTITLHKIMGMPFNRMFNLQMLYNVPISEGAMWGQLSTIWSDCAKPVYEELYRQASNCTNYYVDDTGVQILEVVEKNKKLLKSEQRKCNTTIICTRTSGLQEIVLYISDEKHCGENFASLLAARTAVNSINMMADASSNNFSKLSPAQLSSINIFKCLAHGRRKFHELLEFEPYYCMWFLKEIGAIYKNDEYCKDQGYAADQRLQYHQASSAKHVHNIYEKIEELFAHKHVEPNSVLGKAMRYWQKHKEGLTKFLSIAGMDLDNSVAEQGFKNIIPQRKNSYFYKTKNSAEISSGLTSLIMTCKKNNINAYGYLNWLQEHWLHALKNPSDYLPWKYKEIIESRGDPPAPSVGA
jgi:transposase